MKVYVRNVDEEIIIVTIPYLVKPPIIIPFYFSAKTKFLRVRGVETNRKRGNKCLEAESETSSKDSLKNSSS